MNSITDLLSLEDSDIIISNIIAQPVDTACTLVVLRKGPHSSGWLFLDRISRRHP